MATNAVDTTALPTQISKEATKGIFVGVDLCPGAVGQSAAGLANAKFVCPIVTAEQFLKTLAESSPPGK